MGCSVDECDRSATYGTRQEKYEMQTTDMSKASDCLRRDSLMRTVEQTSVVVRSG